MLARLPACPVARGRRSRATLVRLAVAAVALGVALPAAAQQPTPLTDAAQAPPVSAGPVVVQPVRSGPVVAFDVKVTEFDGDTATLLGGYGGWLTDERFLVGGAGYWLVDAPNDVEMFYGGLLLGWQVPAGKAIRFGVRGLVGGGQATLWDDYFVGVPDLPDWPNRPRPVHGGGYYPGYPSGWNRYYFYQGFFIFEPQADATIRFGDRVGLHVGVGYRLIAGADQFNDRLQGLTGSVAVQFGVF